MNCVPLVLLLFGLASTLEQPISNATENITTTTTQSSTTATTTTTSKEPPTTSPRPSKANVTISVLDSEMFCYCYRSSISLWLNLHTHFKTHYDLSVI